MRTVLTLKGGIAYRLLCRRIKRKSRVCLRVCVNAYLNKGELEFSRSGKHTDNAYVEAFNSQPPAKGGPYKISLSFSTAIFPIWAYHISADGRNVDAANLLVRTCENSLLAGKANARVSSKPNRVLTRQRDSLQVWGNCAETGRYWRSANRGFFGKAPRFQWFAREVIPHREFREGCWRWGES